MYYFHANLLIATVFAYFPAIALSSGGQAKDIIDCTSPYNLFGVCPYPSSSIIFSRNAPLNATEPQVKDACVELRNYGICRSHYILRCGASQLQPLIPALTEIRQKVINRTTEFCDKPDLFANFQVVVPCIMELVKPDSAYNLGIDCLPNVPVAVSAVIQQYVQLSSAPAGAQTVVVNSTEIIHGLCCVARGFAECSLPVVRRACASQAAELIKTALLTVRDTFNCTQIINAQGGCPGVTASPTLKRISAQQRKWMWDNYDKILAN